MRRSLLAALTLTGLLGVAACGPTNDTSAASGGAPATGTPTGAATTGGSATGGGISPEQLCGLLSVDQAAQASGFEIDTAKPSMSGDVAVCTYRGGDVAKLIIEYQPDGAALFNLVKSKGEPVAGLGQGAVYLKTSGELQVLLGGNALFHCFTMDVRMHGGDPRGGTTAIAQAVVPRLPGA